MIHRLCAIFASVPAAIAVSACATAFHGIGPGATAAEVHTRMGPPAAQWHDEDGTLTMEYPRGPEGTETVMIDIGPDGKVSTVRQVLGEPYFAKIATGMDKREVRRILGRPARTTWFELKREEVWDWLYSAYPGDAGMYFHVHFGADGKVTGTSRTPRLRHHRLMKISGLQAPSMTASQR